eukprot:245931-Pelagomonas_calceolata.AAC.1
MVQDATRVSPKVHGKDAIMCQVSNSGLSKQTAKLEAARSNFMRKPLLLLSAQPTRLAVPPQLQPQLHPDCTPTAVPPQLTQGLQCHPWLPHSGMHVRACAPQQSKPQLTQKISNWAHNATITS